MAGCSPVATHVAWPMMMPLALKLAIAEELLRRAYPMELLSDQSEVVEIWVALNKLMLANAPERRYRSEPSADSDRYAIDTYFRTVGTQFVAQYGDLDSSARLREFIDAIKAAVESQPCATCVVHGLPQSSTYVCRWTMATWVEDQRMVANRGECIEPVARLFRSASIVAGYFYEASLGVAPSIHLRMATNDEFGAPSLNSWIDGKTFETSDERIRLIEISFGIDGFRPIDYVSLFYVLMHECVAHGHCGMRIDHAEAMLANNFHEGWMDWVALNLCERVAEAGLAWTDLVRRHQTVFEDQALRVFHARHDPSAFTQVSGSTERQEGRRAFHVLLKVFQVVVVSLRTDGGLENEASHRFMKLSMQINASSITPRVRSKFVARVVMLLWRDNPEDRKAASDALPELRLIVGSYLDDEDAELFVSQVLQLSLPTP